MIANKAERIYKEIEENKYDSGVETALVDYSTGQIWMFGSSFSVEDIRELSTDVKLTYWNVQYRDYIENKLLEIHGEEFEIQD